MSPSQLLLMEALDIKFHRPELSSGLKASIFMKLILKKYGIFKSSKGESRPSMPFACIRNSYEDRCREHGNKICIYIDGNIDNVKGTLKEY